MSRVQCVECGTAVVVDPTGVCPEGHLVGGTGVRVAGAMGSDTGYPDEPEPWVATVVLDEVDDTPVVRERTIRPVRLAGADEPTASTNDEAADHEAMLRELHALADIPDASPGSAGPTTPAAPSRSGGVPPSGSPRAGSDPSPGPATAGAAEAVPVSHTPPPPQEQVAEGFAELSALEAAFHKLGHDQDPPLPQAPPSAASPASPAPASAATADAASRDDLADLEELFASQGVPAPESTVTRNHLAPAGPTARGPDTATIPLSPALAPPAVPAANSGSAATADHDRVPAHNAPPPPSPAPSMPSASPAGPDVPPPPAAQPQEPPTGNADGDRPASRAGVDITNFTAHGGKVGTGRGGRRKRFGR